MVIGTAYTRAAPHMRRTPCLEREAGWPGEAGQGFLALGPGAGKAYGGLDRKVACLQHYRAGWLLTFTFFRMLVINMATTNRRSGMKKKSGGSTKRSN